jgi:hypothetical protein
MAIGGPAGGRAALLHNDKTVSIGERQILVAKRGEQIPRLCKLRGVERLDAEVWEGIEKSEKLSGPISIEAAKKPAVPFSDNQR